MSLQGVLICLVLAMLWLVFAQFSQPESPGFPTQPASQPGCVERPIPSRPINLAEASLPTLGSNGIDPPIVRIKPPEAGKRLQLDLTVQISEGGPLGSVPGTLGTCKAITATCPPGRPFLNIATRMCMSVAEIKALP